jgi:hypothetical protein
MEIVTDDDKDLDELFAALRRDARDPGDHPTPEELSAYHAKELSPADDLRVREHIVACRECADLVLDLQALYDAGRAESSSVVDLEQATAWRNLQERMEFEPEKARPLPSRSFFRGFFASTQGGYSVAAALLAAVCGLTAWNVSLLRERREPRVIPIVRTFLESGSLRTTGEPPEPPLVLPAPIILSLPPEETPDQVYRVDFVHEGERHPEHSLEVSAQGTELSILLPEGALRPGPYDVKVVRPSLSPVRTYKITIDPPSS